MEVEQETGNPHFSMGLRKGHCWSRFGGSQLAPDRCVTSIRAFTWAGVAFSCTWEEQYLLTGSSGDSMRLWDMAETQQRGLLLSLLARTPETPWTQEMPQQSCFSS